MTNEIEDDGFEYNKQAIKNMWEENEKLREALRKCRHLAQCGSDRGSIVTVVNKVLNNEK